MAARESQFDALGGEPRLRAIIDDFVERTFADMLIGFLFARANKARVKDKEYEHAAQWLGAPIPYSGRPLREAHSKHAIRGGQFARRRKLLADTLRDHGVDEQLVTAWLAHQDSLRSQITGEQPGECNDPQLRAEATSGSSAQPSSATAQAPEDDRETTGDRETS